MLPEHIYHRHTNPQPIHCHTIKYINKQYQQLQLRLHAPASPNASNSEQGFIPQPRGDKMRGKLVAKQLRGKKEREQLTAQLNNNSTPSFFLHCTTKSWTKTTSCIYNGPTQKSRHHRQVVHPATQPKAIY